MAFDLKTRVWQNGALEWWGMIDGEDMYLGNREFPLPSDEGDEWTVRATGDRFRITNGEVVFVGKGEPVTYPW